ncbi:MAG: biotin/lipoyl-binding protein [Deltaproteobacteria bacterium]|nr:biotin/lipoyl-binding protein [Deltaproteobacteria bacterium]
MAQWFNDGAASQWVHVVRRGQIWHVRVGDTEHTAELLRWSPPHLTLRTSHGRVITCCVSTRAKRTEVTHQATTYRLAHTHRGAHDGAACASNGEILAPLPGRIIALLVETGARVQRGQPVCVIEAMKMQNEILAPSDGTVQFIAVNLSATVEGGTLLMKIG